jgi:hypothetical protein
MRITFEKYLEDQIGSIEDWLGVKEYTAKNRFGEVKGDNEFTNSHIKFDVPLGHAKKMSR